MLRQLRIALLFLPDSLLLGFLVVAGPFLLREEGAGAAMATAVGYVTLPFAVAFLWAPFVDRHPIGWLGRRAGWAGLSQLLAAGVLAAGALWLASVPDGAGGVPVLLVCLAAGVALATRNIALGAWMREGLHESEMATAVGARFAGASIGNWLGSGVLASQFPDYGWPGALAFAALALLVTWPAILALPGDRSAAAEASTDSLVAVAGAMFRRPGLVGAVAMLFVLSAVMAPPFGLGLVLLSDRGFTAEQIGWSAGYGGSILCAAAALACGGLASRFGLTAMIGAGVVLQIGLSLAWAGVALGPDAASWLIGGAVMVAQMGVYAMMSAMWMLATLRLVSLRHAASEIALVNAFLLLGGIVAPNVAGLAIDAYPGWARFFVVHAAVTALAGIAVMMVFSRVGLNRKPVESVAPGG
ncbi:MFS transporter [Methylopila jiangsuensis]|uniref:MFS transporter n=1 Tax=Methylopila jiangsuensis TaxID=586230 RepID=A0A9W6N4P3_9HYPH|nr:hypothetical protein [Methylopila jiangsuensis]MDR6285156.1 hypothetical protein [Methylopila jiangsuensis]GLK77456.1 MFS transporter [Methylopila jiangsuensis]